MISAETLAVAPLAVVLTVGVFALALWDGKRVGLGRPRLWAAIAAAPIAVGFWLYLFVPAAPMTGVIMTSNTGLVLYGFEREVSTEDDEPAEPGQLPK